MSKNSFTPGPWLREGRTVYALMHAGWRHGEEQFKNRFYFNVQADRECPVEEAEANAQLIAAAPELLDALKYARRFLNQKDHDTKYIDDIIQKAEGR